MRVEITKTTNRDKLNDNYNGSSLNNRDFINLNLISRNSDSDFELNNNIDDELNNNNDFDSNDDANSKLSNEELEDNKLNINN